MASWDFDAYWTERTRTAPTIRIFGETVTLPPGMPTPLVLAVTKVEQLQDDQDVSVVVDLLDGALYALFGDRVHGWSKQDPPPDLAAKLELLLQVLALYNPRESQAAETTADTTAAKPASGAGIDRSGELRALVDRLGQTRN